MPEFPKNYANRYFKVGGPTGEIVTKMILHDGTVLGPDAKPIPGTGPKPKPKPEPTKPAKRHTGLGRAARAAARHETSGKDEEV